MKWLGQHHALSCKLHSLYIIKSNATVKGCNLYYNKKAIFVETIAKPNQNSRHPCYLLLIRSFI
jgi:hypothetical protein